MTESVDAPPSTSTPTETAEPTVLSIEIDTTGGLTDALTSAVAEATIHAEKTAALTPGLRVILRLSGSMHSSHNSWPGAATVGDVSKWETALRRLERLEAPTISVVKAGCDAYGPAAELLLTTDYRILDADTVFSLAQTASGAWPSLGLHRLVGELGTHRTGILAVQGRPLAARTALEWGLIDAVGADDSTEVAYALGIFASTNGTEVAIRRRLILDAANTRFEDALGVHLAAADRELRYARAVS